jgi:EAL domain-containing protein (putative c-di-GMP-specific phosphodiesterase class I)
VIKIDRSFIADLEQSDRDATIVETTTQATTLNSLRCELAQGWLYSRAIPRDEIAGLFGRALPALALH